jgi:small-conductance mechanosensitive channel
VGKRLEVAQLLVKLAIAVVGAALAVLVTWVVLRLIVRRVVLLKTLTRRMHRPFQAVVVTIALNVGLRASSMAPGPWRRLVIHIADLTVIAAFAWLVTSLLFVVEEAALAKFRTDVRDNRYARTIHTQVTVLRRATVALAAVAAVITMTLTFREARAVGAGLLASAGVAAVIGAFAAQALLGNVFAGLQLAFGRSLRLEDVVVVEQEWGRIEAITLTYVVVHIWDDRRLIFPTSYFTTTPFQNWTRSESSLLGSVEMEVDWTLPVEEMREELRVILADTDLWDERIGVLQVTDAVGGLVRLRALVSALDAPRLWDLRCYTRERLITWLRENHPEALPRARIEAGQRYAPHLAHPEAHGDIAAGQGSRVFGGDAEGRERGAIFHGPAVLRAAPNVMPTYGLLPERGRGGATDRPGAASRPFDTDKPGSSGQPGAAGRPSVEGRPGVGERRPPPDKPVAGGLPGAASKQAMAAKPSTVAKPGTAGRPAAGGKQGGQPALGSPDAAGRPPENWVGRLDSAPAIIDPTRPRRPRQP